MSIQKICATQTYTNLSEVQKNLVVVIDGDGNILSLESKDDHDPASVRFLEGALIPGYVNAHCHLELSHMYGKVNTGTGLLPFIESVVSFRDTEQEVIDEAIQKADQSMWDNGIVAVGDICNKPDTFETKKQSPIYYHSFVEMFDFLQAPLARETYDRYKEVYDMAPAAGWNARSAVPHAPYSVSKDLFQLINQLNQDSDTIISIHNQETPSENQLWQDGGGDIIPLFSKFGFSYDGFEPLGKGSIHYALSQFLSGQHVLFVHNTLTESTDIEAAHQHSNQTFWVSCPNANLYIENRLPDYQAFMDADAIVCLGTDSLTSNWQLSIFEEMKTIARYQSYVPTGDLVKWATINGARALGREDQLGIIDVGRRPGLNLITLNEAGNLDHNSSSTKLV